MADKQVKVKKVKAYPIPTQIKGVPGNESFATVGQIHKLALTGFLCEVPPLSHQPGDKFVVAFELPAVHLQVTETIVMVKLYNQWAGMKAAPGGSETAAAPGASQSQGQGQNAAPAPGASSSSVQQLAEYHFVNLSLAGKESILKFLKLMSKP